MNIKSLFSPVEAELAAVERELGKVVSSPEALLHNIGIHLLQAGGKRLRPALFLLCAKNGAAEEALYLATAIELIHMATLVHDDVIDVAATRRGKATANVIFGNHSAVLTGDFLFATAFSLVAQYSGVDRMKILTKAICVMCEGEMFQKRDLFKMDQTFEVYFHNINCKTADFIAASCELGALVGRFSEDDVAALREYGYSIGMAFQITDDLLDVAATMEEIGKPTGNDLKQGVWTLPVLYSMRRDEEIRRRLAKKDKLTDDDLSIVLKRVRASGALEYSAGEVEKYLTRARCVLPKSLSGEVRDSFMTITEFIGKRKF